MASMQWNGNQASAAVHAAGALGLFKGAEHVLAKSREVVPIEESTLSGSGATSLDEPALTAAVSYDTKYAARQHEELNWRHDTGRTAKYLERPLKEEKRTIEAIIAAEISKGLQ